MTLRHYLGALLFAAIGLPHARADPIEPARLTAVGVTAERDQVQGRACLAVELDAPAQAQILDELAKGQMPADRLHAALLPDRFGDGTIDVDITARPNGKGAPDSRGFAGLAFRVASDGSFEAVYLRMTNGRLANPPPGPPRDARAVQYVSMPEAPYFVLRRAAPGRYEAGADVAPDRWTHLRLEVKGALAQVFIDGAPALTVPDLKHGAARTGTVGLFVDDGTRACFSNLVVVPAADRN